MIRRMSVTAALAVAASAPVIASALALDLPARKPGLWELDMSFEGRSMPMQKMQHCIDAETDKMLNAMGTSMGKESCPKQDMRRAGDTIVVDSVCDFGGGKTTSHAVLTGDFSSAYTVKVDSTREGGPTMPGMKPGQATHMTIAAKWLGACKAGQKPGDIIMPNGMTMNIRNIPAMPGGMPKR